MAPRGVFLLALLALATGACYDKGNDLQFCSFDKEDGVFRTITCANMTCEKHLDDDMIISGGYRATKLLVANSTFRFFRHNTFVGMKFAEIALENCDILSLTDTDVAFEGLEDTLSVLSVTESAFVSHWDWSHLGHLRALKWISVSQSLLDFIGDMKGLPQSVTGLYFYRDGVSSIHPEAFSHLRALQRVMAAHNQIEELKRTMLPNPAKELAYLQFSHNRISSLPADFFENMPNLAGVDLDNNQFFTIEQETFSRIINRLLFFNFLGNPVRCDCRLRWLTPTLLKARPVMATCSTPSHLLGKFVMHLKPKDLWC